MTKIDIAKTELVWPGKYNDDGGRNEVPRVRLPFQVIETVNESRATREVVRIKGATLFDTYEGKEGDTIAEGWKNKLIWGERSSRVALPWPTSTLRSQRAQTSRLRRRSETPAMTCVKNSR